MTNANFDENLKRADALLARGDRRGASAFYSAALRDSQSSVTIDRNLVDRAQRALQEIQRAIPDHIVASLARDGFPESDWHPRFRKSVAMMQGREVRAAEAVRYPQIPQMFYYAGLPHLEFADVRDWFWREPIETATEAIRQEASALLGSSGSFAAYVRANTERPQGDVHGMLENADWTTHELTTRGRPDFERIERTPLTYSAVSTHAPLCDIPNRAPSIMFSRLSPGKRIPPHHGMINTRLICHLPLIVPGPGILRVGSTQRAWQEGQMLAFDDSIEHEACNDASQDRMVLIFDVWRPELEDIERAQIRSLFNAVDTF